ncbi:MAG: magnesium transporter CorA family protein, partial [Candidatus Falkowbacteria bacterium]
RVPEKVNNNIITVPLLIAVGRDFVLTVSSRKCSLLNDFISGKVDFYTTQKTKFFLQLFFAINEKYNNFLVDMNKRLRNIKVRLERVDAKDLVQFVDFEQVLNDFLSALVPTDSILQKVLTGRYIELYEKDKDLIEDISLGNTQLIEVTKSSLRYAVNIRDTYSNIATHDLNRIMKILTVLTILLTIPNVIFGFFGMNVLIPNMDLSHSYLWIIGSTVVLLITLLFVFIKKKWL